MDDTTEKEMLRLLRGILATVNSLSLAVASLGNEVMRGNAPEFLQDPYFEKDALKKDAERRERHMDSLVAPDLKHPAKKTLS